MPRRITKVKMVDSGIRIEYQIVRPDERVDEYTLTCADQPRPGFLQAMQAIVPTLPQWLDAPDDWCAKLTVTGVSYSWAHDIMGATVTARRTCSANAPLIINAPHKPSEPYSEGGDEDTCLTSEQRDALKAVISEAEAYIIGDRAQGSFQFVVELPEAA